MSERLTDEKLEQMKKRNGSHLKEWCPHTGQWAYGKQIHLLKTQKSKLIAEVRELREGQRVLVNSLTLAHDALLCCEVEIAEQARLKIKPVIDAAISKGVKA